MRDTRGAVPARTLPRTPSKKILKSSSGGFFFNIWFLLMQCEDLLEQQALETTTKMEAGVYF